MIISSNYICPVNGLMDFKSPDSVKLENAVKAARDLGIDRLIIPVPEEALLQPARTRNKYLDGLAATLEIINDNGLRADLQGPAQRIAGLDWTPPYMVKPQTGESARPVYTSGKRRNLPPFDWWKNPSTVKNRIALFREITSAVSGHPGLSAWILMDGVLTWSRPDSRSCEFILKSYVAEIHEKDSSAQIQISSSWRELADPFLLLDLLREVDGIFVKDLDSSNSANRSVDNLESEILWTAYLGTMAEWICDRPAIVETGWLNAGANINYDMAAISFGRLSQQGVKGVCWVNLIDPETTVANQTPWNETRDAKKAGLFDPYLDPKPGVEEWIQEIRRNEPGKNSRDFIDISRDEYLESPRTHLYRLWDHFRQRFE